MPTEVGRALLSQVWAAIRLSLYSLHIHRFSMAAQIIRSARRTMTQKSRSFILDPLPAEHAQPVVAHHEPVHQLAPSQPAAHVLDG